MLSLIFFALRILFVVQTLAVKIECNFAVSGGDYICQLYSIQVDDAEVREIVIGGNHLEGRSDDDVTFIMLFNSEVPSILKQTFETFKRLENLIVHDGGLKRIQRESFLSARNLQRLTITSNKQLKTIPANAFREASKLTHLTLGGNQIETISLVAFSGLRSLRFLFLGQNKISFLPINTFRPLESLQHLVIGWNFLKSVDGRIFANNNKLNTLDISANNINGIEKNLLDQLIKLRNFDARGNKCVNRAWTIESDANEVSNDLRICFENFIALPEKQELNLEIRGKMTIRDEEGNKIVEL